jgi:hypothetical protein
MRDDLVDLGDYPEIYADGLGEAQFLGANARLVLFTWHKMDGVFRRKIAATVVRPVSGARSRYRDDSGRQGPAAASALLVGDLAVARQPNDPPA